MGSRYSCTYSQWCLVLYSAFSLEKITMRIGFTCSTFDLLHAGHVQMLRDAKEQCDYLIVGLQLDPSVDRKEKN